MSQPTFLNKVIKFIPNWLWILILPSLIWFFWYFTIFKFDWTQIASFWNGNWDKVIASIGSIATAIAVGITSYDLQKRYRFEKNKFEFESDSFIKILPLNNNTQGVQYNITETNAKGEPEFNRAP